MNSHFTARNAIGNAKKAQQRVGYIHEKNNNNGTLNSTLPTMLPSSFFLCLRLWPHTYCNNAAQAFAGKHPLTDCSLRVNCVRVPWLPSALMCQLAWERALCVAAACKYVSPCIHVTFIQVQFQTFAPEAPGTSNASVTAAPVCVYLLFIPPGLSHHTTMSSMPDGKSGQFPSHVSIHFTVFTLDFSNMFGVWNSGGGEK